ncbi:2774_t:CDS:2, partial [Funneliformis geosporum]
MNNDKDTLNFLLFVDNTEISSLSSKDTDKTNDSKAICIYCHFEWAEGRPQKMRQHLASHCEKCPKNIAHIFAKEVANETVILNNKQTSKNDTKRIKVDSNQTNMYQLYDN